MKHTKFTIGKTRHCTFTRAQLAKVSAGLDLFLQTVQQKDFRNRIEQFSWQGKNGRTYNRFLLSNHLSDTEVWERIENGAVFFNMGAVAASTIAILPCETRRDMEGYTNFSRPTIWLNKGYLNQDWYTAVHVASAIAHDLCDNLGFHTMMNDQVVENVACTVPYFCGKLVLEICKKWQYEVTDIRQSFDYIEESKYDYFPCSVVFRSHKADTATQTSNQKIASLIDQMTTEMDSIKKAGKVLNPAEYTRYSTLSKTIEALQNLQETLAHTSLDGSDSLGFGMLPSRGKAT